VFSTHGLLRGREQEVHRTMTTQTLSPGTPVPTPTVDQSLINYTHLIYGLHAFAVVMGLLTTATTVVGGFIFSLPSIVAVILNYARRSDVQGTWLESHFTWQIRTFWYALLWAASITVFSFPLMFVIIGFVTWCIGVFALGAWIIYRVARGWNALNDRRPMYV
jgi:uncharacterized membrane protein